MITSRRHQLVSAFRGVARGDDSLSLLDGWHLLHDAAAAGIHVETVAVAGGAPDAGADALLRQLAGRGTRVADVSTSVMEAMSPVRTPTGVVALARRPQVTVDDLLHGPHPLIVAGIDMQDAGNVGAMIRSADAGGATGVVFAGRSADPWGWKALRAAMGSTFRLPVMTHGVNPQQLLDTLRAHGLAIVATVPRGGTSLRECDFRRPVALLIGGEGPGLVPELIASADEQVSIPMRPGVESLNAAVAAALLVYEAARQRVGSDSA